MRVEYEPDWDGLILWTRRPPEGRLRYYTMDSFDRVSRMESRSEGNTVGYSVGPLRKLLGQIAQEADPWSGLSMLEGMQFQIEGQAPMGFLQLLHWAAAKFHTEAA